MEQNNHQTHLAKIKIGNIIYPILIGLGVVAYLIWKEFDIEAFTSLSFTGKTVIALLLAILCMFGRDIGYIIRLKVLSSNQLSWVQAFRVIMLWEFTSAITPSAIGGTSFAIIYVHKEGINLGKSSSIVLLTSFLDELYFVIMFPLLIALIGPSTLFGDIADGKLSLEGSIVVIAFIGYALKTAYTLFISYGLFINPSGFKWLLYQIFRIKPLRRWQKKAEVVGDEIIESSNDIKGKNIKFWVKVLSATFLSWSSRYLVVNAILFGFFVGTDHLLLFARQLVMWIMMLVMPTPGGSGFTEYLFKVYLSDFIPEASLAILMALFWRLVTYYPYLIMGAIIFPRWVKSKFVDIKK